MKNDAERESTVYWLSFSTTAGSTLVEFELWAVCVLAADASLFPLLWSAELGSELDDEPVAADVPSGTAK